jgi:glycosyltransferase involved in cell wall biosynthesis
MEEVKISIIVPVYKAEASIARCIEAILWQTYRNIELLLVVDGSPDNSGAICDSYANDPRVKVIHNTNRGVSYTRNTGLAYATGDYIAFCDSDDYYAPDHIEKNISTALSQDSDITISGYYIEQRGEFVSSVHLQSGLLSEDSVVRHFTIDNEFGGFCWNKLYKREILHGVKFPTDLAILEDTYFLCSALEHAKKIYYLAEPLYYYCDNQNSATRRMDMLYSDHDTIKYIDSYRKILADHQLSQQSVNIIHGVMFEMSVGFRSFEYQGRHRGNQRLMENLEADIKLFRKGYYHCSEFSLKRKVKWTLKMLWPRMHR